MLWAFLTFVWCCLGFSWNAATSVCVFLRVLLGIVLYFVVGMVVVLVVWYLSTQVGGPEEVLEELNNGFGVLFDESPPRV